MHLVALSFAADKNWVHLINNAIWDQYQLDLPDVTFCYDRNNGSKEQKKLKCSSWLNHV